jgi:hypothetical protein
MNSLLTFAALVEAATGMALIVVPSLVVGLLLGGDPAGIAVPLARVAGVALVALGVGCWPGPARLGMVTYGALVATYLAYLGLRGEWVGPLLWPAVVAHAVLTFFLARGWPTPTLRH